MSKLQRDPSQASKLAMRELRSFTWMIITSSCLALAILGIVSYPVQATSNCPPGEYWDPGLEICKVAPPGHYAVYDGLFQCGWGGYQPLAGQSSCLYTDPGHYSSWPPATSQFPCAPGTYQDQIAQGSCKSASPGYYVATAAATAQTACPVGTYQNLAGQASCNACPAGTFQNMTGQAYCWPAPVGHYVDEPQSTSATECSPGDYQDEESQTECKPAPEDTYVDTYGATEPTDCPAGTSNPTTGATSASACIEPPTSMPLATTTEEEQQAAGTMDDAHEPDGSNASEASQQDGYFPRGFAIAGGVLLLAGIASGISIIVRRTGKP